MQQDGVENKFIYPSIIQLQRVYNLKLAPANGMEVPLVRKELLSLKVKSLISILIIRHQRRLNTFAC